VASIIGRIDLGCASNLMRITIGVTALLYQPPKCDSKTLFLVYAKK
jgi:hypothetical protein